MDFYPLQFTAPLVDIETDPTRMVTVTLHGHGRISRIKVEDSPIYHFLRDDHVEVEVEYCGMNFTDNYLRLGIIRNTRFPIVMGSECCGVIKRVGHGVGDLKVGQRVLCLRMMGGLFRRLVRVPQKHCFLIPDNIDLEDAIGLGLNYLVAHVCLFELGALLPDQVVFMQSIAGGVGTALTQLAHTVYNVEVLGTASESKHEELLSNGVKKVFSHSEDYVQEVLKLHPGGVDIIINSNGGPDVEKCFKMLKQGGTLLLIGSNCTAIYPKTAVWSMIRPTWDSRMVSSGLLINKNYTVAGVNIGFLLDTNPEMTQGIVARIFKLFCENRIKPRIHAVLPFEKVADGMTQLCERKNFGKIILELRQRPVTPDEPDASSATAEETQPPADAPAQPATEAPAQATEAPAQATEAPAQATEAPAQATEAPAQATEAPAQATEAPAQATEAPAQATEAPAQASAVQTETPSEEQEAVAGPAETKEPGDAKPQEAEAKSATEAQKVACGAQ